MEGREGVFFTYTGLWAMFVSITLVVGILYIYRKNRVLGAKQSYDSG